MSLPLWERGLKCVKGAMSIHPSLVAPLVGAWIEIKSLLPGLQKDVSLPLWERGLKYRCTILYPIDFAVAPLVGAWIEIVP